MSIINQMNFIRVKKPLLICKKLAINNIIFTTF